MTDRQIQTAIFVTAVLGGVLWLAGCATGGGNDSTDVDSVAFDQQYFSPAINWGRIDKITHAVSIGLNSIDASVYGTAGRLPDCELDAEALAATWRTAGYPTAVLLTKEATRPRIKGALITALQGLSDGDRLIVSISSHGGQRPDTSGDESDGYDEYLLAYDGPITDDTIHGWLDTVTNNVEIVFIVDACHSGTMQRVAPTVRLGRRAIPRGFRGQLIMLAGCTESGTSESTGRGGAWTLSLCSTMRAGRPIEDWYWLASQLTAADGAQQPVYAEYGDVTDGFRKSSIIDK